MANTRSRAAGVTLVELMVVMGILAIIGAAAIPTLAKLGAFSSDAKGDGARELQNMLKAARVYAATFRVDTAVYYTLAEKDDAVSDDGTVIDVIDGFGLARALTDKERREQRVALAAAWGLSGDGLETMLDRAFFPVQGREGALRLMPYGACLPNPAPITNHLGMQSINLYMDEDLDGNPFNEDLNLDGSAGDPAWPRVRRTTPDFLEYDVAYGFPAHVFRPTGEVLVGYGVPPRVVLEVSPSPDAPLDEQYVEYVSASDNNPVDPVPVQLYAATGRVVTGP